MLWLKVLEHSIRGHSVPHACVEHSDGATVGRQRRAIHFMGHRGQDPTRELLQ